VTRRQERSQWSKTRNRNTPARVGEFFERLVQALIGGELFPPTDSRGDLDLYDALEACAEIKAGDNNHPIGILINQLRSHENIQFPYNRFLYFLCCYKNRQGRRGDKRRKSLLHRSKIKSDVHNVLAKQTDTIYVFDLKVVQALEKFLGVVRGRFAAQEELKTLNLRRDDLARLADDLGVRYFGLDRRTWVTRNQEVKIGFRCGTSFHLVSFKLVTVLTKSFHPKFYSQMEKQILHASTQEAEPLVSRI